MGASVTNRAITLTSVLQLLGYTALSGPQRKLDSHNLGNLVIASVSPWLAEWTKWMYPHTPCFLNVSTRRMRGILLDGIRERGGRGIPIASLKFAVPSEGTLAYVFKTGCVSVFAE